MKPLIADFRSDTVTRPTEGMLRAMAAAPVGDDVLGDDPTVQRLESVLAERFGMEAGLFCPSGTMTNQIAVNVHTRPGDELICSKLAHVYNYEGGGLAFNSGVQVRVGGDNYGRLSATDAEALLQPMDNVHAAPTRLVVAENTSNKGGGTTLGIQSLRELGAFARQHSLAYHLDGARLFNAIVADREQPEDYGRLFDSISICLSKGLGAPVGSVLLGSAEFIREGRRIRKRFGGGMRQAGYLAAAGIYALDHHVERLAEDHARAASLATYMAQLPYVAEIKPAATNMVLFRLQDGFNGSELLTHLSALGVQLIAMDRHWLRAVLHYDVGNLEVQRLTDGLASWAI
jgi:threonine aldolase